VEEARAHPGASSHRDEAARRLQRASGALATAATARMDQRLPWFCELPADERAWVGLVAQAGISAFVDWFAHEAPRPSVSVDVFDTAPRDLARVISLEQTVEMVRCTIDLIEERLPEIAGRTAEDEVRTAVLLYSREVAFAAAEVYARAAEARGAWDARLEALVLDGLLRQEFDPTLAARAAALGWAGDAPSVVLVGPPPENSGEAQGDLEQVSDLLRRSAHHHGIDVLAGLHARTLVVIARTTDSALVQRILVPHFGPGPVVVSATTGGLADLAEQARRALAAWQVSPAWPEAPRLVPVGELLPELALAGDGAARSDLVASLHDQVHAVDPTLIDTLAIYLERAGSLEATARALFVHVNTVRHRLRRIEDLTGRSAADPRDALALRLALLWARLDRL
jgi:hypothetical protein